MNEHHNADASNMIGPEIDKLLTEAIGAKPKIYYCDRDDRPMKCSEETCDEIRGDNWLVCTYLGKIYHAYSTSDHAAQDWLKAAWRLLHRHDDCDVYFQLCAGGGCKVRILAGKLDMEAEREDDDLSAALVDCAVEKYCKGCGSADCVPRPKELMGYRIKPALAAVLKGDGRE